MKSYKQWKDDEQNRWQYIKFKPTRTVKFIKLNYTIMPLTVVVPPTEEIISQMQKKEINEKL